MPNVIELKGRLSALKQQLEAAKKAYDAWGVARAEGEAIKRGVQLGEKVAELQAKIAQAESAITAAEAGGAGAGVAAGAGEAAAAGAGEAAAAGEAAVAAGAGEAAVAAGHTIPATMAGVGVGTAGEAAGAGFLGLTPIGWIIIGVVAIGIVGGVVYKVTRRSSTGETKTSVITKPGGGSSGSSGSTGTPFTLDHLSPDTVQQNSTQTVQVIGTGFFPGADGLVEAIYATGQPHTDADGNDTQRYADTQHGTFVSSTEFDLTVQWTLKPGTYDLLFAESRNEGGTLHVWNTNSCTGCLHVSGG